MFVISRDCNSHVCCSGRLMVKGFLSLELNEWVVTKTSATSWHSEVIQSLSQPSCRKNISDFLKYNNDNSC